MVMRNRKESNQRRDIRGNNGGRTEERRLNGQGRSIGSNGREMSGTSGAPGASGTSRGQGSHRDREIPNTGRSRKKK